MAKMKTKICQNCKSRFVIEPEDFEFYKKVDVPEPTFCPECRIQRRCAFVNQRNLYKRKDSFSNKEIFSQFSPEAPVKVYELDFWNSDKWDPMNYGKDYSFNRSFLEQFGELLKETPLPSRTLINSVNSDYCMAGGNLKNCYLLFNCAFTENSAYSIGLIQVKDSYDSYRLEKCELCYEGFELVDCYKAFFSSYCTNCQEIYFCSNCVDCQHCFGCVNLRHKKYHIFNQPYSEKEYFEKIKEFKLGSYQTILSSKEKVRKHHLKYPVRFIHGRRNNNVTGDDIYNSKNVFDSFSINSGENLRYCLELPGKFPSQDSYDFSFAGINSILVYDSAALSRGINRLSFCAYCYPDCRNMEYCFECHSCSDLFGCVSLRHKQYCILNKQYTKEEYEELIPKIKKHMDEMPYKDKKGRVYKYGEFFPAEMSPFAYNETMAQEYFPLTKEQALEQGYRWYNKPKPEYKATIKAGDLPDNIKDADNLMLKEVIECSNPKCQGSSVFRLIPPELKFYKKYNIPLPRLCPDCRHNERIKQRSPLKLWERQCMKKGCQTTFQTTYAPERKEIIYCEKCYNKEVG